MSGEDIEAIRQLKAKYFRCLDTKDWPGMRSTFGAKARVDVSDDDFGVHDDIDAYLALIQRAMETAVTVHHGHTPEIHVSSPTTADGIWAMEDNIWFEGETGTHWVHGYGHYHERYEKDGDGHWHIVDMRLKRLKRDFT
jgi:hypothetical protein